MVLFELICCDKDRLISWVESDIFVEICSLANSIFGLVLAHDSLRMAEMKSQIVLLQQEIIAGKNLAQKHVFFFDREAEKFSRLNFLFFDQMKR